ncbi:unnamed protein product, partial [Mesorhabditis spiculigera]
MRRLIALLLLPVVYGQVVQDDLEMSAEDCQAAGFYPDVLKCSTCEELLKFELDLIYTDCKRCCIKEKEAEHEKFPIAHVEVCECNLARFPQVQAFVHKDMADQFGGKVKVKHVRGVRPQIKLKDYSGNTKQLLNIEKWDTNTIIDFLTQWIE